MNEASREYELWGFRGRTRREQFRHESALLELAVGRRVIIGYTDGDGRYTVRAVTVTDSDARYVWGNCELRGEERCFARRRISFIADPSDPDLLSNPEACRLVMALARQSFPALFAQARQILPGG